MNRKFYVAGHGTNCSGYSNWMQVTGAVNRIEDADLIVGLGGADVSSKYYNQPNSRRLQCNSELDLLEYADFQKAIKLGKKIIGICKSSQWGAALAGGAIFQDVHHPQFHNVKTFDGKTLLFNSTHHNMQDVRNLKEGSDYKLLAWAEGLSTYHIDGWNRNNECKIEPEVVYYPKINFLSFQNHNEWLYGDSKFDKTIKWSQDILNRFMVNKL